MQLLSLDISSDVRGSVDTAECNALPGSRKKFWEMKLGIPSDLLAESSEFSIDVSKRAVRMVHSSTGDATATYTLPDDAMCGDIDEDTAICKLRRRRGELVVSWQVTEAWAASPQPLISGHPCAQSPEVRPGEQYTTGVAEPADQTNVPTSVPFCSRSSLDYTRFAKIGEDIDDGESVDRPETNTSRAAPLTSVSSSSTFNPANSISSQGGRGRIDYSRFEDVNEEDALLDQSQIKALYRRHQKLRRMRGEDPLALAEWRRRRAIAESSDRTRLDPFGRGLWCQTNLEDTFENDAAKDDIPPDNELPSLPTPDMFSALKGAPGARVVDITTWASAALREELTKACATDRLMGQPGADIRVDVIAHAVKIEEGNAGLLASGLTGAESVMCAYRFRLQISCCINVMQRPPPEEEKAKENHYNGTVQIAELVSGIVDSAVTQLMRTSLQPEPKPLKEHIPFIRPVLSRFELSLVYFLRRFERRLMQRASMA